MVLKEIMRYLAFILSLNFIFLNMSAIAYQSSYDLIQWEQRADNDKRYCIDITDENWNVYPDFQAVACGDHMYEFSPRYYVENILKLPKPEGVTFHWRVWSESADGHAEYGGNGFEGKVTIGSDCGLPYRSDSEQVQWGCRFQDVHYCVDLFDENWQPVKRPFACGDNLHSFDPRRLNELNLPSGKYHWKVWSEHAFNFDHRPQRFFEGAFDFISENPTTPATAPEPQVKACEDISGKWSGTEKITVETCVKGRCEINKGTNNATINITQRGCDVQYTAYDNGFKFDRIGKVTGNEVAFTGIFFKFSDTNGCYIKENAVYSVGKVVNNKLDMESVGVLDVACYDGTLSITGHSFFSVKR